MRSILIAILLFLPLACSGPKERPDTEVRAIWITRFDYLTEEDVVTAVEQCAEAGFNTLMFQVRGNATTFFPSSHEPWAEQLGWEDPGFDPLAVALQRAAELDVEVHAWVNVVTGWWGPLEPTNQEHLYYTHPEWFWYDQYGARQAMTERFYVSLNPCLPEVREHIVKTVTEIAQNYEVAGVHLDYIRFPNEAPAIPAGTDIDYPRDARTLELYAADTSLAPEDDPDRWDAWRTQAITTLLRELCHSIRAEDSRIQMSAAVGPIPERALHHFQDVEAWIEERLLNYVFPMNYTSNEETFGERVEMWKALGRGTQVVMGCMLSNADIELRMRQVETVRGEFSGVCVFAYSSLFDSPNVDIDTQDAEAKAARRVRREAFLPFERR